jgi:DnaJ-class molecular chaperone
MSYLAYSVVVVSNTEQEPTMKTYTVKLYDIDTALQMLDTIMTHAEVTRMDAERKAENTCRRCGGRGTFAVYRHIQNGICFTCGGSGIDPAAKRIGTLRTACPQQKLRCEPVDADGNFDPVGLLEGKYNA